MRRDQVLRVCFVFGWGNCCTPSLPGDNDAAMQHHLSASFSNPARSHPSGSFHSPAQEITPKISLAQTGGDASAEAETVLVSLRSACRDTLCTVIPCQLQCILQHRYLRKRASQLFFESGVVFHGFCQPLIQK